MTKCKCTSECYLLQPLQNHLGSEISKNGNAQVSFFSQQKMHGSTCLPNACYHVCLKESKLAETPKERLRSGPSFRYSEAQITEPYCTRCSCSSQVNCSGCVSAQEDDGWWAVTFRDIFDPTQTKKKNRSHIHTASVPVLTCQSIFICRFPFEKCSSWLLHRRKSLHLVKYL